MSQNYLNARIINKETEWKAEVLLIGMETFIVAIVAKANDHSSRSSNL
jgi:hypothetical protein